LVANEQGAKVFPASFGQRVAADNELLSFGQLDYDPGTTSTAAFVDRIQSFRDQALEAKLLGHPDQLLSAATKFLREPDIVGDFLRTLASNLRLALSGFLYSNDPPEPAG
jgi:hypothetical protein